MMFLEKEPGYFGWDFECRFSVYTKGFDPNKVEQVETIKLG